MVVEVNLRYSAKSSRIRQKNDYIEQKFVNNWRPDDSFQICRMRFLGKRRRMAM
jgi:hypothetical protein